MIVFFLDGFVNRVWEVVDGHAREYNGNYSEYERVKLKEEPIEQEDKALEKNVSTSVEKERKRQEAEARNLRYKKLKPLEKRLAEVESRLENLMAENEQLQSELADSNIYEANQKDRLMKTMEQQRNVKEEERGLMGEWDELNLSIEQIQNI